MFTPVHSVHAMNAMNTLNAANRNYMNEHRYILEPYKGMNTRFRCPNPQCKGKTFVRYVDTETGKYVHSTVGRCNRESNCGYHYTPKQYFQENNISFEVPKPNAYKPKTIKSLSKPVSFISIEEFKASLKEHNKNNFVTFLISLFGIDIANELISRYFIATSKHWNGATIFWQIDTLGKVRTGKIMLYNPTTGKRVKEPFNHIHWVHKVLKQPEFELKQCLYGEHLLVDGTKPIAIVESEKTAIIASVYLPQFIWLAVGSLTNLNTEKCSILKGRTVTLFPDLNGFEKWKNKAIELSSITLFNVSDLLERKASEEERKQGLDLADYLIKFDFKVFAMPEPQTIEQLQFSQSVVEVNHIKHIESKINLNKQEIAKLESWEQEICELETYFTGIILPTKSIMLNQCTTVKNVPLFIEQHFATVKANIGKSTFLPYLNRICEMKRFLQGTPHP